MRVKARGLADGWGVKFDGDCSAALYAPDEPVAVQLNGEPVTDPRTVVIADCDVIKVLVGDPPAEFRPAAAEGC
jgi:hypothetical protein